MFITKGVLKTNVPANGGTLQTITGSAGAAKIPLQILDFTQNVTGNISIPNNTYGYFQINERTTSLEARRLVFYQRLVL